MTHYKPSTGAGCNLLMNVKPPSLNLDDEACLAADSSNRFSVQEPPQVFDFLEFLRRKYLFTRSIEPRSIARHWRFRQENIH